MKKSKIRSILISGALIWGVVIIYVAYILKGTEFKNEVISIIAGGIIFHLLFIWIPLGKQYKSKTIDKN